MSDYFMKRQWEWIGDSSNRSDTERTYRLEVPGGWLYRYSHFHSGQGTWHEMVFVPKPREARDGE